VLENHSEIRAQFPFLKKIIYLDSAHYTPYPLRSVNKLNEFITKFTTDHLNLSLVNLNQAKVLRETCGKLLNCSSEDIIITSNTTHGINIFRKRHSA
jgi:cysteine desulfurase/selenocysteine lyase